MSRKNLAAIAVLGLIALVVFVSGPFITAYEIRDGIRDRDAQKLSANIDFLRLRENLKQQINGHVMRSAAEEKNKVAAVMAVGFSSLLTDRVIDAYVTPEGLAKLLDTTKLVEQKRDSITNQPPEAKRDLLKDAQFGFDSLEQFSVVIPKSEGRVTTLVLTRDGFSWKLSNIVLPL